MISKEVCKRCTKIPENGFRRFLFDLSWERNIVVCPYHLIHKPLSVKEGVLPKECNFKLEHIIETGTVVEQK